MSKESSQLIKLPVQTLNWESFNIKNLRRILFQFEVEPWQDGEKTFSLVAYSAFRKNGKWKLGGNNFGKIKRFGACAAGYAYDPRQPGIKKKGY